jgi:STE24 endopeptidase
MEAQNLLYLILAFITLDYIFEQWLDYLNLKNQKPTLPEELKEIYDEQEYSRSQNYQRTQARFSLITSTFSFLLAFLLLSTGTFGWLDEQLRPFFDNPVWLALAYFGIIFLASDLINIPFQWHSTFVIEEKFGFNKTTPKIFMVDKLKGYLLAIIIGGLIVGLLLYLIIYTGKDFWIYFWIAISLFTLFMNMFYTSLIVPLFNKLKPLEAGELQQAILSYSEKVNFPLTNIFVIDGSKRSTKANAFFSGIGKRKKIVLYDTLINNHSTEELVAVLAHEVGHFKKNHLIAGYALSIVQTGIILWIMSLMIFSPVLSDALGGGQLAIHLNLIAFSLLFAPISKVTGILLNIISRKNEYEADYYARSTYGADALVTALKKLSVKNLSNLTPHPYYVFVHYSHPPLLRRLKALQS